MGMLRGFSVAAVMKRICKAALKKGLGDLFLGDLDLDQLDLQLTRGTLQLSDLALNADFINAQLSTFPFMVKEGSIKSLLVKFPLRLKSCEIVVEDLELVLAPSVATEAPPVDAECSVSGNTQASTNTKRKGSDIKHSSTSASRDVDEGIQRIANAVKWFLTSFNIKFKNTYIVFDPQTIFLDDEVSHFNRSLVFRVRDIEFGTNLSTEGLVKLNNFVTFNDAVVEFLKMDDVDVLLQNDLDKVTADISSGHSTISVLTGPVGGFSGTLNLSIPWSNGCLNLKKVDADVSVDSLELLLQISSIQWFMHVLDSLLRNRGEHNCADNTADMFLNNSRSALSASKSVTESRENLDQNALSQNRQDKYQDSFLTKAHVIQHWIPELVLHEDQGDPGSDCDKSIDQFFECFEELRNSRTDLENSGIWDWTCSVFNAITFASTLASGSDQVPKEPQIEKTLRASIAEISVILLLNDEMDAADSSVSASLFDDMRNSEMFSSCLSSGQLEQSMMSPATASSLNMHHLEAKCQNIHLELETYSRNLGFKASIAHMKLDEYYSTEKHNSDHSHLGTAFLNNNFCREVQAALPQFPFAAQDCWMETAGHFSHNSDRFIKVELLKTFGECTFHYDVSNTDQDGNSGSSTSLSIYLAPLILWVHFHTVYIILNFIRKVESDVIHGEHKPYRGGDEKSSKLTNTSSNESLKVQITPSHGRIILCFPYEPSWDLSRPSILDKFLVIDHTSSQKASSPLRKERSNDGHLSTPSTSLHLATGNFGIYFVKPVGVFDGSYSSLSRQTFSALKIFSVSRSDYHDSSIRVIRRGHPVTCPEMVNKAWSLPNLHDQKITPKENNKWVGVVSSTTSQDLAELSFTIRQELIESTEFLLHVRLPCVSVHLNKKDCGQLNQLLDLILDGLSDAATCSSENGKDKNSEIVIQTSVIFECSMLDICTELDETVEVGPSLQTELEGSWNRFKLSVSELSLCSFCNVGGVNNSSFLWVNHGEGELWGSVSGTDDQTCEESKDFLLVICKDSASQRGGGEGNNLLSFGTAGCSVTHIRNPKLQEKYTSVNVLSGTLVAPGGRMDWISAISLLFSSGSSGTEQSNNSSSTGNSQVGEPPWSSFFLELADVALSYEPHLKNSTLNAEAPDCKFLSCLLAASSLKLHRKSASDSAAADFDIKLRDLGLLICGPSDSKNKTSGYDVAFLRQMGYAKIGHNTFMEAALRIDTSFWKLEISESQFEIDTCRDTTYGLVRLVSQLQKLYAPDMQDALVHLQSKWNIVQQANTQNVAGDASDMSESSTDNVADSGECKSDGLLDDIIENAFCSDQAYTAYNFWDRNCHNSLSSSEVNVQCTSGDDARKAVDCDDGGWYRNNPLTIVENHVSKRKIPHGEHAFQQEGNPAFRSFSSDESCNLKGKILIHDIDVKWRMYAGDDWPLAQNDSTSRPCSNGRDTSSSLEFIVSGLGMHFDMYPDGDVSVSKLSIFAQDLNLCDQNTHAPWKMVLGCYDSKDYPRESCSTAFKLELESVRPEPQAPLEDYRLCLEILPLQLHLDQGQLNFLISFFQNDSSNSNPHLPCENEILVMDSTTYGSSTIVDEALLPFFQKFEVKPLVLHINYIPRHFDPIALGKGNYAELLNILPLKGIDLKLKNVSAMGVYGWNSICETVAAEWLEDISKNQVHKLLKGLPPIKSLVAVGSGTKKLVSLPIKSYKKDRKLLKGMQRGAVAFIRSVSIESVELGVHLAAGAHDMLLKTERALTDVPPSSTLCKAEKTKHNIRANQPESARQGLKQAYESLTDGLGRTASALIGNPIKFYNRGGGPGSVLATAICGAPAAAVAPVSASARAVHYALLGLRNSLDPEHKKESAYKYSRS